MLQAFGASSVIAVGAGTIGNMADNLQRPKVPKKNKRSHTYISAFISRYIPADITEPAERGGYIGWYSLGYNIGPVLGPAIGGFLSQYLGWRWIFWLLAIVCGIHWCILGFWLPETLRLLVGRGDGYSNPTPQQWWRRRQQLKRQKQQAEDDTCSAAPTVVVIPEGHDDEELKHTKTDRQDVATTSETVATGTTSVVGRKWDGLRSALLSPLQPLLYIKEMDVLMHLTFYGAQYAASYAVTTTTPYFLARLYGLNESLIGVCYLSSGLGCVLGSILQGKVLNINYRRMEKQYALAISRLGFDDLPIEANRMHTMWFHAAVSNIILVLYGWCIHVKAHIGILLAIHFLRKSTFYVHVSNVFTIL